MDLQKHRYMVSQDIVFDKVSCYYLSQVISFEKINHNNKSDICSKPVVEFSLSYNTPIDFSLTSSSFASTILILHHQ